jgi:hypothetical protein
MTGSCRACTKGEAGIVWSDRFDEELDHAEVEHVPRERVTGGYS